MNISKLIAFLKSSTSEPREDLGALEHNFSGALL